MGWPARSRRRVTATEAVKRAPPFRTRSNTPSAFPVDRAVSSRAWTRPDSMSSGAWRIREFCFPTISSAV